MTEEDFKVLFSPKFKGPEDIKDDKIIMVNEVVNLTLPIIDSTYVNHHLDKSLLMVSELVLKLCRNCPVRIRSTIPYATFFVDTLKRSRIYNKTK